MYTVVQGSSILGLSSPTKEMLVNSSELFVSEVQVTETGGETLHMYSKHVASSIPSFIIV
jgi:hypothetical protein